MCAIVTDSTVAFVLLVNLFVGNLIRTKNLLIELQVISFPRKVVSV